MAIAIRQRGQKVGVGRNRTISLAADAFAFIVGATISFNLRIVGDLPIAELILLPLVTILIAFNPRRAFSPLLTRIYAGLFLWLFGLVASDIYHETSAVDWMRGDAAIIFFWIDLASLAALLAGNELRKMTFIAGSAIGTLLAARFTPSPAAIEEPWKFGYSTGVVTLVLLVSCYFYARRRYVISGLLIGGIAFVNLIENYRSLVLVLLVALVLTVPVIPERIGTMRILPRRGSFLRVAMLAGFVLGAGWLAGRMVSYVTEAGLVSEEAQEKNRAQAKVGGFLLGGRPEILVSSRAVAESPILGHGSWARDLKYTEMLYDIQIESGEKPDLEWEIESMGGLIPSHSHLMGAWVWAGILGATFWTYVIWLAVRGIIQVSVQGSALTPYYAFIVTGLLWAILFSPFGQGQRFADAFAVVVIVDLLKNASPTRETAPVYRGRRPWNRTIAPLVTTRRRDLRQPRRLGVNRSNRPLN
jgi:hypothetical protein